MSDLQITRVACLGAGFFSRFHVESWQRLSGAELVAICDHDLEKAQGRAGVQAFDSPAKMLAQTNPDLVDIILPPSAHGQAIRQAINTGAKAIICQKPFCASLQEARSITAEAEAAGIPLIVHENFRFQPWYRAMAKAISSGRIGTVLQATFRLRPGDGQGPSAYLDRQPYFQQMPRFLVHETAVHWIDTFRFLFGDPLAVYADLRRINPVIAGEDAGFILFDHPGGVRAVFDGNRHLDHAADNLRRTMGEALIEGTKGTLTLYGDGSVSHRAFLKERETVLLAHDMHDGFGGDCVHALNAHVLAHLHSGAPLENPARDYLKVLEIEEAVYESAREGRKVCLS